MHFFDKVLQHFFGDLKVGNDAVFERPNSADITGGAAEHAFCFDTDGLNCFLAVAVTNGDHRWLVEDDAFTVNINKCVCRAQIDGQVVGKHPA